MQGRVDGGVKVGGREKVGDVLLDAVDRQLGGVAIATDGLLAVSSRLGLATPSSGQFETVTDVLAGCCRQLRWAFPLCSGLVPLRYQCQ